MQIIKIDTANSPNVIFPNTSQPFVLTFKTDVTFRRGTTYHVVLDDGVAVSMTPGPCGDVKSTGFNNTEFWSVTATEQKFMPGAAAAAAGAVLLVYYQKPVCYIGPAARPVICMSVPNGRTQSYWCLAESSDLLLGVACNVSLSLSALVPGLYSVHAQAYSSRGELLVASLDGTVQAAAVGDAASDAAAAATWSPWSEWTPCSGPYDVGIRQRRRVCAEDAKACVGDGTNVEFCTPGACSMTGEHYLINKPKVSRISAWRNCLHWLRPRASNTAGDLWASWRGSLRMRRKPVREVNLTRARLIVFFLSSLPYQ